MKNIITLLILLSNLSACSLLNILPSKKLHDIQFNEAASNDALCDFTFPDASKAPALITLKEKYALEDLVKDADSDLERALRLLDWTNARWEHSGTNQPKKRDALSILEEAEAGANFRCVEYGVVLTAALNAMGIPARILALKTADVEKVKYGAGHVLSEAYLPDLKKWVFMDGQMNYIPFLDGIPLNAVEYQKAITTRKSDIQLKRAGSTFTKEKALSRIDWVSKYLYYISVRFDNSTKAKKCDGKSHLMLVPIGAENPTVFQRKSKIDYCKYTNNIKDFYRTPVISD